MLLARFFLSPFCSLVADWRVCVGVQSHPTPSRFFSFFISTYFSFALALISGTNFDTPSSWLSPHSPVRIKMLSKFNYAIKRFKSQAAKRRELWTDWMNDRHRLVGRLSANHWNMNAHETWHCRRYLARSFSAYRLDAILSSAYSISSVTIVNVAYGHAWIDYNPLVSMYTSEWKLRNHLPDARARERERER